MATPTITLSPTKNATPNMCPARETKASGDHRSLDTRTPAVTGIETSPQARPPAITSLPPPEGITAADDHLTAGFHNARVIGLGSDHAATGYVISKLGSLHDPTLDMAAAIVDDLERTRMANANRLEVMTRTKPDEDGVMRGWGLDESHPDVARLAALVAGLKRLEDDAVLNLQRVMRKHPLNEWRKRNKGAGEKQTARLLAAIGDPYWNTADDCPRTVSGLWRYCGYDPVDASNPGQGAPDTPSRDARVARRRQKGQPCNWSAKAKSRAYLMAESCLKQKKAQGPLQLAYEERRAHTAVTHPEWTAGHSHNDALRVTAKEILKQLWREAKAINERELT
jgi:hypothetical protein